MSKRNPDEEQSEKISRDDIEAKFRELTGGLDDTVKRMSRAAVAGGAAAIVLLLIFVFIIGRSKGRKKTTLIEIVRV